MEQQEKSRAGRYGLQYHLVPPYGLMNDPNGLIYFKGQYHVFFQWNPTGCQHANKHWGHLVSEDMLHWKRLPLALAPDQWFDKNGVYSGSAFVHQDELWLFYTGNVKDEEGNASSYQCLAVSQDGIHFEKRGPLFEHPAGFTRHVRDPKVWFDERVGHYWMVLGAQHDSLQGDTLVYQSHDLVSWELTGSILSQTAALGYMWECPDVVLLGEKDAFIFSPQGLDAVGERYHNLYQTVVQLGHFNEQGQFLADNPEKLVEVDAGFDYYAPQTFTTADGRVLQYAWMGIPEGKEMEMPTIQDGWIHSLTIPRELSIEQDVFIQRPARELVGLRTNSVQITWNQTRFESIFPSAAQEWAIRWNQDVEGKLMIRLRDEVTIRYDQDLQQLSVYRTDWQTKEQEVRTRTLQMPLICLQAFMDGSSLELFINDGQEVFSLRFFAEEEKLDFIVQQTVDQEMMLEMHTLNGKNFIVE